MTERSVAECIISIKHMIIVTYSTIELSFTVRKKPSAVAANRSIQNGIGFWWAIKLFSGRERSAETNHKIKHALDRLICYFSLAAPQPKTSQTNAKEEEKSECVCLMVRFVCFNLFVYGCGPGRNVSPFCENEDVKCWNGWAFLGKDLGWFSRRRRRKNKKTRNEKWIDKRWRGNCARMQWAPVGFWAPPN